jgi:predicted DNA binding CopG/RHH family protein
MKEKKAPRFASEDEERKFWGKTDSLDYVDWSSAQRVVLPNLKPTQITISLRIPAMMLAELKKLANKRDVPYQSLLKVFLAERLEQELRVSKSYGADSRMAGPADQRNAVRERQTDCPPSHLAHLVRKVPLHELPSGHRRWTGNDASQRNQIGLIPSGENPVFLELRWKKDKHAAEKLVGGFEINVKALAREGYLAAAAGGGIRLRFIHRSDGYVCLGRVLGKNIRVGRA